MKRASVLRGIIVVSLPFTFYFFMAAGSGSMIKILVTSAAIYFNHHPQ